MSSHVFSFKWNFIAATLMQALQYKSGPTEAIENA